MKLDLCEFLEVEEGQEFQLKGNYNTYRIYNNKLEYKSSNTEWSESYYLSINELIESEIIKLPRKKEFTEDELNVFRLIPKEYEWCARDKSKTLFLYKNKPIKDNSFIGMWIDSDADNSLSLKAFSHLFQSISYKDEEPIYIPDYVVRD